MKKVTKTIGSLVLASSVLLGATVATQLVEPTAASAATLNPFPGNLSSVMSGRRIETLISQNYLNVEYNINLTSGSKTPYTIKLQRYDSSTKTYKTIASSSGTLAADKSHKYGIWENIAVKEAKMRVVADYYNTNNEKIGGHVIDFTR